MQGQMPGNFMPHMNSNMQASPVGQGHPQMAMALDGPNQQAVMQQRHQMQQRQQIQQRQHQQQQQQQQHAMLQHQQRQQQQQQQQQQQRLQQRSADEVPGFNDDASNTQFLNSEQVTQLAMQMQRRSTEEDFARIRRTMATRMDDNQKIFLQQRGIDPVQYYFRTQAALHLRRRMSRMENAQAGNSSNTAAPQNDGMMNQQAMVQNMMNLQRNNTAFSNNATQSQDSNTFFGNVENIQGQQADGVRSQEAGQLVVPVSSSQMGQAQLNNQQGLFTSQPGPNGQNNDVMNPMGMNTQMFTSQHMQQQFHAQQARVQAAHKAQMAMSGQVNPSGPAPFNQQQSPAMSMLNQGMSPTQTSPIPGPAQVRPPSRPATMGQVPGGMPVARQNMQGRPQIPSSLPQAVQDHLSSMTDQQLRDFFENQRRNHANNHARGNMPHPPPQQIPQQSQQGGLSQDAQTSQMFNGQMGNMRNSMSGPGGINPTGTINSAAAMNQNQPPLNPQSMTPQQRAAYLQRQNEIFRLNALRQQSNAHEMTAEQQQEMDRVPVPHSMIANYPQVPQHIKTWAQLKAWSSSNPLNNQGLEPGRLMNLQKVHFVHIAGAKQAQQNQHGQPNQLGQQLLSAQPNQQHPQGQPNHNQLQQGFQGPIVGPAPPNAPNPAPTMTLRPITQQDIQIARQKLGSKSPNFTDDQIRDLLQNRQRVLMEHALQQQRNMSAVAQQGPRPTASVSHTPVQAQPVPLPQQPPHVPIDVQAPNSRLQQVANAAKSGKAPAFTPKSKKRPTPDDAIETAPAATAATPQQNQGPPASAVPAPQNVVANVPSSQEAPSTTSASLSVAVEASLQRTFFRGQYFDRATADHNWNTNLSPELLEFYKEVARTAPVTNVQDISPESKEKMVNMIQKSLECLCRLDILAMHALANAPNTERNMRNLFAMRHQVWRQFTNTHDWTITDHFTVTPDYLSGAILYIRKLFHMMLSRAQQQQERRLLAEQGNVPIEPEQSVQTSALTPANLQQLQHQHQQQDEALQRAARASSQSAAVAAAPFGAPSPQGIPAYGPGALAPENLKLPPPKRRKVSEAGPTAASKTPVLADAEAKLKKAAMDVKPPSAPTLGPFKCSDLDCPNHYQGLPTQAALDKHIEENHKPEVDEVIEDPLQYFRDSLDIGLGLTASAQGGRATQGPGLVSDPPQTSSVRPGPATPASSMATPMARATSQLALAQNSPAHAGHALPAPQETVKKSDSQPSAPEATDLWANALFTREELANTFRPIVEHIRQRDGTAYLDDLCAKLKADEEAERAGRAPTEYSPDSDDLAGATQTPRDENNETVDWSQWTEEYDEESAKLTAEWMRIPPELQDHNAGILAGLTIDWDRLEREQKEAKAGLKGGGVTISSRA